MFYKTATTIDIADVDHKTENMSDRGLGDCIIVERLYDSPLVAFVSRKDPRMLNVYNRSLKTIIRSPKFRNSILAVRINRERIVVILEDTIIITQLQDGSVLHTIHETPLNRNGVIDLSNNMKNALFAFPGSSECGSVIFFDTINLTAAGTFRAHESVLQCLKFNEEGNMIATASTKGTVIRVFEVATGNRLFEFRRGVSRYVTIYSLCFSADSKFLSASSNTETVHIFKLKDEEDYEEEKENTWLSTISAYIPTPVLQVGELIVEERAFATAKVPGTLRKSAVALITHKRQNYVMAATSDGFVYTYLLDRDGGELALIKQHRIGPNAEDLTHIRVRGRDSPEPKTNEWFSGWW